VSAVLLFAQVALADGLSARWTPLGDALAAHALKAASVGPDRRLVVRGQGAGDDVVDLLVRLHCQPSLPTLSKPALAPPTDGQRVLGFAGCLGVEADQRLEVVVRTADASPPVADDRDHVSLAVFDLPPGPPLPFGTLPAVEVPADLPNRAPLEVGRWVGLGDHQRIRLREAAPDAGIAWIEHEGPDGIQVLSLTVSASDARVWLEPSTDGDGDGQVDPTLRVLADHAEPMAHLVEYRSAGGWHRRTAPYVRNHDREPARVVFAAIDVDVPQWSTRRWVPLACTDSAGNQGVGEACVPLVPAGAKIRPLGDNPLLALPPPTEHPVCGESAQTVWTAPVAQLPGSVAVWPESEADRWRAVDRVPASAVLRAQAMATLSNTAGHWQFDLEQDPDGFKVWVRSAGPHLDAPRLIEVHTPQVDGDPAYLQSTGGRHSVLLVETPDGLTVLGKADIGSLDGQTELLGELPGARTAIQVWDSFFRSGRRVFATVRTGDSIVAGGDGCGS